jgi:thiol-disulfide isomerase/thioredoxin
MAVSKSPPSKTTAGSGKGGRRPDSAAGKTGKSRARANQQRNAAKAAASRQGAPAYLWAVVALVVVAVVVFVLVAVVGGGPKQKGTAPATGGVVAAVASVPQSVLTGFDLGTSTGANAVGSLPVPTAAVSGAKGQQPLLTVDGKPEVFYFGAEFCPYCAAERWALINALSRFGTFKNLSETHSSATDVYPNTPTFSFYKSSYSSPYLVFVPVEYETNTEQPLQRPTPAESKLVSKYDTAPYVKGQSGSIPFIDFANQFIQSGANFNPGILAGMTYAEIASAMQTPGTTVGSAIDGAANYLTAAICQITNDKPASVCNQPYIPKALAQMQTAAKSSSGSSGNATPGVAG